MDLILADGGEGIIMQEPTSCYIHGRNNSLWKFKVHVVRDLPKGSNLQHVQATRADTEALVEGISGDTVELCLYEERRKRIHLAF